MSQITNLDSLSIGKNGIDTVTISSSGLSLSTVSMVTGNTVTASTSLIVSGIISTKIGAATAAANIIALPILKSFYRISSATNVNLKGIGAGIDGQQLELYFKSGGTAALTISPQSTAAGTTARIVIMTTAATLVSTGSGYASFRYSSSDSRWLCKYLST